MLKRIIQLKRRKRTVIHQVHAYHPFVSPHDPCRPKYEKYYITPPNLFVPFQPANLPQFPPQEALAKGTLWPLFYSPYSPLR